MSSDLRGFAAEIRAAAARVQPEAEKVLFKGAMNIKKDMQSKMRGSGSFGALANSITFDIKGLAAEIGPVKGGGGAGLGFGANIAYFGGTGWGGIHSGGTVEDPEEALKREIPAFEKYLAEAALRGFK